MQRLQSHEIDEILLFTMGDSNDASVWSNVPFLMAREFENQGVRVNRVNIAPSRLIEKFMNRFLRLTGHNRNYTYKRSRLYRTLTRMRIRRAVAEHPRSKFAVFLCFDFVEESGKIPSLVFSDWTYAQLVVDRMGLTPDRHMQDFIDHQRDTLHRADVVMPLFGFTYRWIHENYPGVNVRLAPTNVVNNMDSGEDSPESRGQMIKRKFDSGYVLFIGGNSYIPGLRVLIDACRLLDREIRVEVIGIDRSRVEDAPSWCHFNGYLRKDIPGDNKRYYDLLKGAKCVVNPSGAWAGYSSLVESLYFHTPVVVSRFGQFVEEFGEVIGFGCYCEPDPQSVARCVEKIFSLDFDDYAAMAAAARRRVKDYTWPNYVRYMLGVMETRVRELRPEQ